jgi:outer membrane protein TolC
MRTAGFRFWLATMALSSGAFAQATKPAPVAPSAPAAPKPAPAGPSAPTTPGAPTSPGTPNATTPQEPTLPNIEDTMLTPQPPAAHVLGSWREALGVMRSNSPNLRISLAQVDIARARARQAAAATLPNLSMLTGNTYARYDILRHRVTGADGEKALLPEPNAAAGVTLRVPVFAPRAWYDKETANQQIALASLNTKEAERLLVASVADTIVSTVTAERLAEVSRVNLKGALSTLDLNKRRASLGASSALDVLRAEQEVQSARGQVVTADEGLLQAREALGLALGTSDGWGVNPDIHLDSLADDARASCKAEPDVTHRSDVRASRENLKITERQKGSVDWAFWPTLDAVSGFQATAQPLPNRYYASWYVGANLNWTIYDGGLRYGQKDEAVANERVAREQLNDTQRRAQLQVTQAFRGVQVAELNLSVAVKAREIAAETARLARVAFMNGSGTSFDLVDTASRLRQAELDLAVKQFQVLRARIAALLALASCDV